MENVAWLLCIVYTIVARALVGSHRTIVIAFIKVVFHLNILLK